MGKLNAIKLRLFIIWQAIRGKPLISDVNFLSKTSMFFELDGNLLIANCKFMEIVPIWEGDKLASMKWSPLE